jgi:outer membrane receptor protein involved in Fe transport
MVLYSLVGALAAGGSVSVEAADNHDLTALPLESLLDMQVYSASRFPQKVSEAPAAVTIITAADIRDYGYRTLADILRSIRSLYTTNDRNYSYLGVRGFGRSGDYNSRVTLLVDGYRTNDNIYDGALLGSEFLLDVDMIQRVEFVPGPGSSVYGSNALFGVINVITRRGSELNGFETSAGVASFGTRNTRLSYGREFANGLDIVLSASNYESKGQNLFFSEFNSPATNNGVAEHLDGDRYTKLLAKIGYQEWSFEAAHASRDKDIPTAAFGTVFNAPGTRSIDGQTFLDAKYYRTLQRGWDFSGRVYYGSYDYDGNYVLDLPPLTVNTDVVRGRWWGSELKLFSQSINRHKLVLGAEYEQNLRRDQVNFDQDPFLLHLDDHHRGSHYGIYAQDEFSLREDLLLSAGLRYDRSSGFDAVTSPRLGLIYRANEATAVKLLYGTAFRTPNAYELYYGGATGFKANPNLSPEKIRTYQLVLERYFQENFRLTATAFRYNVSDLINLTTDPVDGSLVFVNLSNAKSTGVEVEAERVWQSGARARMSYTNQETRDGESGQILANSPRQLAKFNASFLTFGGLLRPGLEMQYTAKRGTKAGNVPGYSIANLTLTAPHLAPGLEGSFSAYNLFDKTYADPASEEHVQDSISQDGRNYRLRLTYRF